ncbi:MAG: MFS transporter [Chloroflexota bacterium]|nr:MFS transporter [Chloroflexota bacterium]MDE2969264.1 MFS transporter [Chloroflexota bacterium]
MLYHAPAMLEQSEPKARAGRKFFYGWVLVAVAVVTGGFNTGVGTWALTVFAKPMTEELEWSRTLFFLALTIYTAVASFLSPIVGPWRDTTRGPRVLMLGGAILIGLSLITLKWVDSLWEYYLFYGVLAAIGSLGIGEALTQAILPKWFIRKRGRAMGIAVMGGGLGPLFAPLTLHTIMSFVGWRDTWLIMGIAVIVVLVPLSFLVRTRPEDIGLLPDGETRPPNEPARAAEQQPRPRPPDEYSLTRSEAVRSPAFWLIILAYGLGGLGMRGFQVNWIPYLQDMGFATAIGALAITAYGVCTVTVRPLWGLLGDRFPVRSLTFVQSTLTASSILLLIYVVGTPMLFAFMILFGVTMGGSFILRPLLVANYFGRNHLGAITGMMRPFNGFTGAIGPVFVAAIYDLHGSYFWSFVMVMIGFAMTGAVILLAKPPRPRGT